LAKKFKEKQKKSGLPLAFFFRIFSRFLIAQFLTFCGWKGLWETKNYVYRRRLLISSIYRVKKWNMIFTSSRPQTALSPGPFKIDQVSNRHQF